MNLNSLKINVNNKLNKIKKQANNKKIIRNIIKLLWNNCKN